MGRSLAWCRAEETERHLGMSDRQQLTALLGGHRAAVGQGPGSRWSPAVVRSRIPSGLREAPLSLFCLHDNIPNDGFTQLGAD